MSRFDFMGFGYDGGRDEMFVAHAKKYTPEQTVELCTREYAHRFSQQWGTKLREPTVNDVIESHCAFRFGVSSEWPDGCYTFVGQNEPGSFPVYVIDFKGLKEIKDEN